MQKSKLQNFSMPTGRNVTGKKMKIILHILTNVFWGRKIDFHLRALGENLKRFLLPVLNIAFFTAHSLSLSCMSFKIQLVTLFCSSILKSISVTARTCLFWLWYKRQFYIHWEKYWIHKNLQCFLAWITIWTILTSYTQHPWNKTNYIHTSKESSCYMFSHGLV